MFAPMRIRADVKSLRARHAVIERKFTYDQEERKKLIIDPSGVPDLVERPDFPRSGIKSTSERNVHIYIYT